MSELKPEQNISVEIVSGIEGLCLLVNDYRVAGPKPWGGGTVTQSFKTKLADIERAIYGNRRAQPETTGETSDGYHTFNELYHHRAVLFSVICNDRPALAWKSKQHHDGTMYGGMFIVGIETPDGQATYHYDIEPYWEMFNVQELPQAPEWDGHTPAQAIERIGKLNPQPENEPLTLDELREELERLEELATATNGDVEETYTNGYRWGYRNGQIELLRRILNIGDGTCESECHKPERSEGK